jgi:hypothetical protein
MKHRQETVAEKVWDGQFGSYDEWERLGPQPLTGVLLFLMLKDDAALLSKILLGRGTIGHFQ